MIFLKLISPKAWAGLLVTIILFAVGLWLYNSIYERGAESVQIKWDAEKKDLAEAQLAAVELVNADSRNLQAKAEAREKAKNVQIANLDIALKSAIAGLSNRTPRPASSGGDVPGPATVGEGEASCTGARLYRDDSELLARLAKDATELKEGLLACYDSYDAAKKAIDLANARRLK